MTLGYQARLSILAFDHRGSFQTKFFGVLGDPTQEETAKIADAKGVIYEGFTKALAAGVDPSTAGILVDEQFGADVAHKAAAAGVRLAMPAEKSGQDEFDFEFQDWQTHIQAFNPSFVKVLVRYNPAGDGAMNARQSARLLLLSDWLHQHDRTFLFELLVQATQNQLSSVDGDVTRFDKGVRPELMRTAIAQIQENGIEPDIWKIEGLDTREQCKEISVQCRAGGRDQVACVVLGRGADDAMVNHWLRTGRNIPGYIGFAIGRSIWWEPLKAFVDGTSSRESAATKIAENYQGFVNVYANG